MLIRLFGGFELSSPSGAPVHPTTRKAGLLLAVLALAGARGAGRALLCALLWPDREEAQARVSLRQALAAARQAVAEMGPGVRIESGADVIRLFADHAMIDVSLFDALTHHPKLESLAAAAELYRGDLLAAVPLAEPLDDWVRPYRQGVRMQALALCEQLSRNVTREQDDKLRTCDALAQRLLATDPTAEEAHRALIRLRQAEGRTNAAIRQFEHCRQALMEGLGVEPEVETQSLIASRSAAPAGGVPAPEPLAPVARRASGPPSLVVMPFDNLSGQGDDYFVDGVVEEITAALSRVRDFTVIARQSAFTYKGRFVDVREVGRELGVTYVVEGTVRRGGERLRISVQLVDAASRAQLWSERYEGALENIFDVQDRIAAQVAGALHPAIRGAEIELARRKPPSSLHAYDRVLRAYPNLWKRRKESIASAIEQLQEAIAIDPAYGRAHALLAWCHATNASYLWTHRPDRDVERALACVEAAGSIQDDPTALAAIGTALSICGDQDRAGKVIETALTLDPNNAWAWARLGWITIYKGEPSRAIAHFERAMLLSPADPVAFNMRIGVAAAMAISGSLTEAIAIVRDIAVSHPDVILTYRYLSTWCAMSGDLETARWAAKKLLGAQPDFTIERYRALPHFRRMPAWADKVSEALLQAGLPER